MRPPYFPIKNLLATLKCESLQIEMDNLVQQVLNEQSIVLCSHFSFVPMGTIEYNFDCITTLHWLNLNDYVTLSPEDITSTITDKINRTDLVLKGY
jgi:pyruvate carboxylase